MNQNVVLIIWKQYLTENKSDNPKRPHSSKLATHQTALDILLFLVYCGVDISNWVNKPKF